MAKLENKLNSNNISNMANLDNTVNSNNMDNISNTANPCNTVNSNNMDNTRNMANQDNMVNSNNMANPDSTVNSISNTGNIDNTNSEGNMKNILFTWFCISSAKNLNIGLTEKQRTCLCEECLEMGKNCLDVAMKSNEKHGEMKVYCLLREASYVLNHYDNAIAYGNKAVDIAKSLGDNISEANACYFLSTINFSSGRYSDALSCLLKYIEIHEQSELKYDGANAYFALGMTYSRLNQFQEAISCCKKSITIARQRGNKYSVMHALLGLIEVYKETDQYDKVLSHAKECISVIQEINSKEATEMNTTIDDIRVHNQNSTGAKKGSYHSTRLAEAAVKTYYNLGNAEAFLKMHQDAIVSFKKCAKIATEIHKEDAKTISYYAIANLYDLLSQWSEVIKFCKKCMHQLSGSKEIETHLRLAKAYMYTNQYDEAIVYGNKCIEMIQGTEDTDTEMVALVVLGWSYLNLNKYDEAIRCGNKYLEIAKNTGHREAETEAHFLLASTYYRLDQIGTGFVHTTKGMSIAEEMKNYTAIEEFKPLLFHVYALIGMHEKASTYSPGNKVIFKVPKCLEDELKALEKARKADDGNERVLVLIRLYNYYESKHQYKKAIECVKEIKALQPTCTQTQLFCYTVIGELYRKMKQYKEGLQYCEAGLREAKECRDKKIQFDFFSCISVLYALNNDLKLAEDYLNNAIQCFETWYESLGSNSDFKISIVDTYYGCFRFLSLVYLQTNRQKEALLVLDRCRARALKDHLVDNYGMKKGTESSDKDEMVYSDIESLVSSNKFAILYYSICGFGNALAFLVAANYFEPSCQQVLDEIRYHQMIDKMFEEIILDNEQDAQQQQNEQEHDEERELLLKLKKRNFKVYKREIWMYDYNGRCSQGTASELLYCLIIGEGESLIKQDEIIIIPDGSLCKIPFAALRDPDTGRYLSENKRIRLAPSIATLKLLQNYAMNQHHQSGALIIGDPLVGKVMMNGEEREFNSLKGAQEEAADIALILSRDSSLLGEEATKAAVLEKLQQGVSIVHIAAHGNLEKAAILLAPSPEIRATKIPDEEDYMLTMADVQQAQVRAQLVVLSCCYSGRGEIRAEGVVGICRAFLASGARAVVASLWAINDKATRKFMKKFYKYLKERKSASTSLHLTMNYMRQVPRYSEPKYWAPFFLIGDDVTLK